MTADAIIRIGNRLIDFALRVDRDEMLNAGEPTKSPEDPAAELMKASKTLIAEGLEDHNRNVDYSSLRRSDAYAHFRQLSKVLTECTPDQIGEGDEATAFWINLYNALIIDGIICYAVEGSLLTRPGFFRQTAYNIGGMRFSADGIEHGVLRNNRPNPALPLPLFTSEDPRNHVYKTEFDPRIHFTLVCGANSCPPISFYRADQLQTQLDLAAAAFINDHGVRYDSESDTLWLSRIFKWYQADFGGLDRVLELVRSHLNDEELSSQILSERVRVRYLAYDWSVNRFA